MERRESKLHPITTQSKTSEEEMLDFVLNSTDDLEKNRAFRRMSYLCL